MGTKKKLWIVLSIIIIIVLSAIALYGLYWIFKTFSYWLFYEDMVQQTIREMIKPEYLIKE